MRLITIFLRKHCWPLMFILAFIIHNSKFCCGSENENFESKYQTAVDLVLHDKSNRDFRRGVSILEELSLGIGRTSADALAELAAIYLIGNRLGFLNLVKAAQYSQRSASLGSPKGRHFYSFFLTYGGLGGVVKNETEAWRQEELAAEQNYLPALMALGYRKLFIVDDCDAALRLYRAAAISAMNTVDTVYFSDYSSLRHLTMTLDSLGDDFASKAARDVETLSYWSFQSDRKDPRAYYELGRIYQLGLHGVRRDMSIAADHYEKAAAAGHAGALGELGYLYTIGHGRELDFNLALNYLQRGAEALDSTALATIGSLLVRKVYFSDDSNLPLLYLRKAVSLNNIEGEWELAQVELREGRLDAALQHLQRAERGDHVRSTMALAQLYDNGLGGLKQSCAQAVLLYKKVCEIGPWTDHSNGPRESVKEFRKGKESSALILSLLAAMEGYEVAQYNAAWMLMRNKGMEDSDVCFALKMKTNMKIRYETSAALLSSLSLQNPYNSESNILLGDIYMGGYIVPHNLNYSAMHYERAADAGNALAMERLALLLITGRGVVKKDHKRAVQLMTHALSQISSGQAKIGGIQALLKQLVLTYRILFLRLCDILKDKLSLAFIERVVRRIRDKVSFLSRNVQRGDHSFTFSNQGASAFSGNSSQNGLKTSVARDADSADSFVLNAISFQNKRHSDDVDVENEVDEKKRTKSGDDSREIREQLHLPDRSSGISLARSSKDSGYMKSKRENTAAVVDSGAKDGGKGPNERDSRKSGNAGNHVADISIEIPGGGVADSHHDHTRPKRMSMKTGMSSRGSSSSMKSHSAATTSDSDADADDVGDGGREDDRSTDRSASLVPEPGPGSGLRMSPLHGQSQSKSDIRLLNSPPPSSGAGTGSVDGTDTNTGSSTDLSSNITQSLQPAKAKVYRYGFSFGFGQKDITSEKYREEASASKVSTVSSTWTNINDFPTMMESIKAPVLSLSSSFYAFLYAPKKPQVKSPMKPSSHRDIGGSGNTHMRNDSVSALIEELT